MPEETQGAIGTPLLWPQKGRRVPGSPSSRGLSFGLCIFLRAFASFRQKPNVVPPRNRCQSSATNWHQLCYTDSMRRLVCFLILISIGTVGFAQLKDLKPGFNLFSSQQDIQVGQE